MVYHLLIMVYHLLNGENMELNDKHGNPQGSHEKEVQRGTMRILLE
jgi:hypothetical protein